MSAIQQIEALEVLDSRGNPTVQVKVWSELGFVGKALVPSGASTGEREALELRDDQLQNSIQSHLWFGQKGVSLAVANINEIIAPKLIGLEITEQLLIDETMLKLDGSENKSNLGANALLGVSLAVAKAAAQELDLPLYRYLGGLNAHTLPVPMLNVINGGAHASNSLDFQEFMIMPLGAKSFRQALQMANHVFHNLALLLKAAHHGTQVGDEGGFAPNLSSHQETLDFLVEAIQKAGYEPALKGDKAVAIALDPAASEFYDQKQKLYVFKKLKKALAAQNAKANEELKLSFSSAELVAYYGQLIDKYPIISIEDGLSENDWEGFSLMYQKYGHRLQIVGDDLTVTNLKYLKKAIATKAINSILIKLNQIGTLSETMKTISWAQKNGLSAVISHRSGETEDTTIADLAVAFNTGQIKTGSLSRTDRVAKYNRLLNIENDLAISYYPGHKTFNNIK